MISCLIVKRGRPGNEATCTIHQVLVLLTLKGIGNRIIELHGTSPIHITLAHRPIVLATVALPAPLLVLTVAGGHKYVPSLTLSQLEPNTHGAISALKLSMYLVLRFLGRCSSSYQQEKGKNKSSPHISFSNLRGVKFLPAREVQQLSYAHLVHVYVAWGKVTSQLSWIADSANKQENNKQ